MKRDVNRRRLIGELRIDPSIAGKRIADILHESMALPNRQIKKVISTRGILLNGRPAHSERLVRSGDHLQVYLPAKEQVKVQAVSMELKVLFEDPWLLVLDKPPGINVHNTRPGEPPALVNGVAHYFQSKGETVTPRPVHRLDRNASGVVLFAKSAEVQTVLTEKWDSDVTRKIYWVLAEGAIDEKKVVETAILGKPAKTIIEPVANYGSFTELRVEIFTGRTHQIRLHLASLGHPVVGDRGSTLSKQIGRRLALHAEMLELVHPVTAERICFVSPPPREAFERIMK